MTVRNAAGTLPRLAASLDGVIDEWFIVDAGSDDDTATVVTEVFGHLPGELVQAPWVSERANAERLLERAGELGSPSHLLLLEQDMVVEADPSFHDDVAASDAHLLLPLVRRRLFEHRQALVVRTGPQWTYGTEPYLRLRASAPVSSAPIDSLRVVQMDDRGDRREILDENVRLLVDRLPTDQDDAHLRFELALHYRDLARWDAALESFREALAVGADPEVTFTCVYQIAEMHLLAGRPAEAAWSYMEAVQLDPTRIEPFHRLGRLLNDQARWEAALVWLEHGAALDRRPQGLHPETWVSAWGIDFELAIARWWTGAQDQANETFEALLLRPDLPQPFRNACEHNLALGGPRE